MGTVSGRWTAALLVATALAAVGCGGDSEESPDQPAKGGKARTERTAPQRETTGRAAEPEGRPTLSVTGYRRTANRLCREDEAALERLGDLKTPASVAPYLRRVVRYARKRQPLFDRLRSPPSLRASHEESKRVGERGITTLARLLNRIEDGGDPAAEFTKAGPAIARLTDQSNRLARRMGAKDCIVEVPSPGAQSPQSSS